MICKVCGNEIADGSKFCDNCGAKIEEEVSENVTAERVEAQIVSEGKKIENTDNESGNSGAASVSSTSSAATTANTAADKKFAIASLVCGIVSLLCCCCCSVIGIVCGGTAIGLGIYVIKKELPGRELAIAGIVCGGVAVLCTVVSFVLSLLGLTVPAASNFNFEDIIDSLDL